MFPLRRKTGFTGKNMCLYSGKYVSTTEKNGFYGQKYVFPLGGDILPLPRTQILHENICFHWWENCFHYRN